MKRAGILVLGLAFAAAAILGDVRTASADAVNAKNAEIIEVTCDNGISETFQRFCQVPGHGHV